MLSSLVIKNLDGEIAQIMLSEWLEIKLMDAMKVINLLFELVNKSSLFICIYIFKH